MIIKVQIPLEADLILVRFYFESRFIDIVDEKLTEHGNTEFTLIADTKHKVLEVANLYFGE